MNCNDTMTFLREGKRMCEAYANNCKECPAYNYRCALDTTLDTEEDYKKMLAVVQKWSDEHPVKTYKEDFLKKFPRAQEDDFEDEPIICRAKLYGGDCNGVCTDCWNEPMKEETK